MKYLVILADGLADRPMEQLNGKTPVMVANTPNIDHLCTLSSTGLLKTIPDSLYPGSEVANMTIMGYDAEIYHSGRGVLEAASMGINLSPNDLVFRCNLITIENKTLVNHSAGHISTEEACQLIDFLNQELGSEKVRFYPGVSYRHLLVIKYQNEMVKCTPPQDVIGVEACLVLPSSANAKKSETVNLLIDLIDKSQLLLKNHPVNQSRAACLKPMANSIWPWSPGFRPQMPSLSDLYNIKSGAVVSAVDLIHGIGKLAGLQSVYVNGATGLYNTNYRGKALAAAIALESHDYVFLHVEACDEAGHEGDAFQKIRCIEAIDQDIVSPILQELALWNEPVTIAFLPDHPTPCNIRTHTRDAVPFMIYRPGIEGDAVVKYDEFSVGNGRFGLIDGIEFMNLLLTNGN